MKLLSNNIAVLEHDSHISKWVEETGKLAHDSWLLPQLDPYLLEGNVAVDGGANIGDHTGYYLSKVGRHGMVMAFEPNPEAYECLVHNCPYAVNLKYGLSDASGIRQLEVLDNVGASYIRPLGPAGVLDLSATSSKNQINLRTLDSFKLDQLNFLKLDIEGWEGKAIIGAQQTISRFKPVMLIEVNRGALARAGCSEQQLLDLLDNFGYKCRPLQEVGPQYDVLCTPK